MYGAQWFLLIVNGLLILFNPCWGYGVPEIFDCLGKI